MACASLTIANITKTIVMYTIVLTIVNLVYTN